MAMSDRFNVLLEGTLLPWRGPEDILTKDETPVRRIAGMTLKRLVRCA